MPKFLTLNASGLPLEVSTVSSSAGAGDAGKAVELDGAGKLSLSFLPTGSLTPPRTILASEALAAGDLVNIWSNAGVENVRKADASAANAGRIAHGFVLSAVSAGANASVFPFGGTVSGLTGLTPGAIYFLSNSTPGGRTTTPPSTAGHSVQVVGIALSATDLIFDPEFRGIRA